LNDLGAPITWQVVARPEDVGGAHIADHWHIFAHGFHWIAFAANGARDAYLLKLDRNFQRIGLTPVVQDSITPTNDLFLVAEQDGVTVALSLPGTGHRLYRFHKDGSLRGTVDIGGGLFRHSNGASAIPTDAGFVVLAPETLNPVATSALRKLDYDSTWAPRRVTILVGEDRTHYAMPSGVILETGHLVVNVRVREGVNPRGPVAPPPPGTDDSGSLTRLIVARDGVIVVSRLVLRLSGVNRPHTTLIGSRLITTWDGPDTGAMVRVDQIAYRVAIDVMPGSDPSCLNKDASGVIPVAILGAFDFAMRLIDPATIKLDGQPGRMVGKDKRLTHIEDVDGDGLDDLVVQIERVEGTYQEGDSIATITAKTFGGIPISGRDSICVVP
jgi:hypothetical protein